MSETIIAAAVTGGLALIGVILTTRAASNRTTREVEHKLEVQQAVVNTKLDDLTREVREHNNFARRMPVLEEQAKETNRRLNQLESYHRPKE